MKYSIASISHFALSATVLAFTAACSPTGSRDSIEQTVTQAASEAAESEAAEKVTDNAVSRHGATGGHVFVWPRSYEYLSDNAVLVFSGTTNWRHDSGIAGASAFWVNESDNNGFGIFTSEHPDIFSEERLKKFSVIVLNSMTGADVLNPSQRQALQTFVEQGGSLILQHGSLDGSAGKDWPWFADMVGTLFISHPMAPQLQSALVVTLAPEHPVMNGLAEGFTHKDEWYTFDGPVSGEVTVLSGLDESTYSPVNTVYGDVSDLRMGPEPSDHPIIWAKCLGQAKGTGRVVFSALGHQTSAYENEAHQIMLRNAMAWARGETDPEGQFCPQ